MKVIGAPPADTETRWSVSGTGWRYQKSTRFTGTQNAHAIESGISQRRSVQRP